MTVELREESGDEPTDLSHRNEVRLVGKITSSMKKRPLPSGDVIGMFRLTVDRGIRTQNGRKTRALDVIDCAVWISKLQRKMENWAVGDVIELSGWLRRRFFRTPAGAASRYEVEVRQSRWLGHTEKPAKSKSRPEQPAGAADERAA